jgi:uncharacterized integral membrane protein
MNTKQTWKAYLPGREELIIGLVTLAAMIIGCQIIP